MSLLLSRLFYQLLLPGNAEHAINLCEAQGNMGLTGIFMGINTHKKLVWCSLSVGFILSYFGYSYIGFLFVLLALIKYYIFLDKYFIVIKPLFSTSY